MSKNDMYDENSMGIERHLERYYIKLGDMDVPNTMSVNFLKHARDEKITWENVFR